MPPKKATKKVEKKKKKKEEKKTKTKTKNTEDNLDFLARHEKQSGVYMIAPLDTLQEGPYRMIKVGMSGDLGKRFKSYLLYWPQGYHIYQVLYTTETSAATKVERALHKLLKAKQRTIKETHAHTQEWFWLSVDNMKFLAQSVYDYFPDTLVTRSTVYSKSYLLHASPLTWGSHLIQPLPAQEKAEWVALWQKKQVEPLSTLKKKTPQNRTKPLQKHPPKVLF